MSHSDEGVPAPPRPQPTGTGAPPRPGALDRVLIALTDWSRAAAAHLWVTRWRTRGMRPEDVRAPAPADGAAGAPILIGLPGIHEEWRSMAVWAWALREDGWDVHLLPELGRMVDPVAELSETVAGVLSREDLRDVVLVAHSKGGLVGKAVLCGPEGWRVRGMVAVAAPFSGSPAARLIPLVPGFRELAPGSPTIRALARRTRADARIIQVEAAWDQSVPAGPLPGAREHVVLPLAGHESMLEDPRAARVICVLARRLLGRRHGASPGAHAGLASRTAIMGQ
jgi:hypothetical protein